MKPRTIKPYDPDRERARQCVFGFLLALALTMGPALAIWLALSLWQLLWP